MLWLIAAAGVAAAIGLVGIPATAWAAAGAKTGTASHASKGGGSSHPGSSTPAAPVISAGASGSSPFSPGVPLNSGQVTTQATPTVAVGNSGASSSAGGGVSGSTGLLIGIAALVVLVGVAFFIWHDARRRAPILARQSAAASGGAAVPGSRRKPKPRKLSAAERRRRKRGRAR